MLHPPRRSSDMLLASVNENVPLRAKREPDMDYLDGRIPRSISITTKDEQPAGEDSTSDDHHHHPTKPHDMVPQKPQRLSPTNSSGDKKTLEEEEERPKLKRNASPKRTKPRRQSGIMCRTGRNSSNRRESVRNMMMLMRSESDRRILRNTLERQLQKRVSPAPEQR